ncbi:hypothetical protein KW805_00425 [Candidatus Pacearchaeota archaeon]|nr:hypothetical protein [Candidatus Pacearchaeota archaeon]
MAKTPTKDLFDEFVAYAGTSDKLTKASQALVGDDAKNRIAGRGFLENIVNQTAGNLVITPQSPDSLALQTGDALARRFTRKSYETFKSDADDIVDYAYGTHKKEFADNYMGITPYKIGKKEHDEIVPLHENFKKLENALQDLATQNPLKQSNAINQSASLIREAVKLRLEDNDPEKFSDMVANIYSSADTRHAVQMLQIAAGSSKQRMDASFGAYTQDTYAYQNLKAAVKKGGKDAERASEELYQTVA